MRRWSGSSRTVYGCSLSAMSSSCRLKTRPFSKPPSVAGYTFSVAAVAAGLEQPEEQIEARCTAWVRQGRFLQAQGTEAWPDGTMAACYGFMHALYHEVVYHRVSAGSACVCISASAPARNLRMGAQAQTIAAELAMHFGRGHDPATGGSLSPLCRGKCHAVVRLPGSCCLL